MITKGSFRILATGFIHSRSQSVITWTTNMNINATNQAQVTLIRLLCTYKRTESVRLRAQLNPIKAIVRLCSSIGKLQLSDYSWLWEYRFIGQFTSGPCYFSDSLMSRLNRDMEEKRDCHRMQNPARAVPPAAYSNNPFLLYVAVHCRLQRVKARVGKPYAVFKIHNIREYPRQFGRGAMNE